MDIGSLFLLLALIIAVAAFIASPLQVRRGAVGLRQEDHELSELLAERERVLEALEELDLDNDMGKVPEKLYPLQRDALLKRGADVLRLLDERLPGGAEQRARIEQVAERQSADDPLEAMIAARRGPGKTAGKAAGKAAGETAGDAKFCPNCGSTLIPGDRFCASCGQKL